MAVQIASPELMGMDDCKEFLLTYMVVSLGCGETLSVKGNGAASLHQHRPRANATGITDDFKSAEPHMIGQANTRYMWLQLYSAGVQIETSLQHFCLPIESSKWTLKRPLSGLH
ncbi:hypothetical protein ABBQ32_010257 [Trebouxia sp. C0010 RCD-2024]